MKQIKLLLLAFLLSLNGCGLDRYFYYPNRVLYHDPEQLKLDYTLVDYPSLNGKKLYGFFFRTPLKPRGTIVHFHGNYGNMTNHFPMALFLLDEGFDVLSFDYQGYGGSEGRTTRENTIQDGVATVRYARDHLRNPETGVAVWGQSLGGAVGLVVTAQESFVKGAVIEAAFTSYRRMSRTVLQRHWFLYPISWVLTPFIGHRYDPEHYAARVSPRPLLFVHGDADRIVPVEMSQQLYAKAKEPKTLWIVPGADHLQCNRKGGKAYTSKLAGFFTEVMTSTAPAHQDHKAETSASR